MYELYRSGNIAQEAKEMMRKGIDIMGISETHWTGQGKVQLAKGDTIIYSTTGRRYVDVKKCNKSPDRVEPYQPKNNSS